MVASGGVGLLDAGACVGKPVNVEVDLYYPPASTTPAAGAANTATAAGGGGGTAGANTATAGSGTGSSSAATTPAPPSVSKLFGRISVTLVVDAKEQPRVLRPLLSDFQHGVLRIVKLKTFDLTNTETLAMFGDKQGEKHLFSYFKHLFSHTHLSINKHILSKTRLLEHPLCPSTTPFSPC